MRETEITIQVFNNLEQIYKILNDKSFEIIEEYEMTDYYFSKLPNLKLRELSYSELIKNSFLVRDIRDENPKVLLTYKDKSLDENNNVISEEKISTKIDNLENALKIFKLINLNCWSILSQKMVVYKKGTIEFALQIVDGLGNFIEYEEDSSMKDLSEYEKITLMKNNLSSLGLILGDDYSCKKIYMKFLQDNQK